MIELKNIDVVFKQKKQEIYGVKNVSIKIEKGEIFGIVGSSGAGKSTLVRVINLLQKPSKGQVLIDNVDITNFKGKALREVRLKMGMIFQHFNLISGATVYQNIEFSLIASKYPKEKIASRVKELLKLVNLEDKINVYPSNLSGGQKQRIAIARALANNPEILLCDEATSALDLENTEEVIETLKKINECIILCNALDTDVDTKVFYANQLYERTQGYYDIDECYEIELTKEIIEIINLSIFQDIYFFDQFMFENTSTNYKLGVYNSEFAIWSVNHFLHDIPELIINENFKENCNSLIPCMKKNIFRIYKNYEFGVANRIKKETKNLQKRLR